MGETPKLSMKGIRDFWRLLFVVDDKDFDLHTEEFLTIEVLYLLYLYIVYRSLRYCC